MEPSKLEDCHPKPEETPTNSVKKDAAVEESETKVEVEWNSKIKIEPPSHDPEFILTTKNLERVREDLRQEEVLKGQRSPIRIEQPPKSPKSETVSLRDTLIVTQCTKSKHSFSIWNFSTEYFSCQFCRQIDLKLANSTAITLKNFP